LLSDAFSNEYASDRRIPSGNVEESAGFRTLDSNKSDQPLQMILVPAEKIRNFEFFAEFHAYLWCNTGLTLIVY